MTTRKITERIADVRWEELGFRTHEPDQSVIDRSHYWFSVQVRGRLGIAPRDLNTRCRARETQDLGRKQGMVLGRAR